MKTVTLYGASDDCICIEGDITDEAYSSPKGDAVAFSDGTIARIDYAKGGLWKISIVQSGTAKQEMFEATDPDSREYSDRLTLTGDIEWAVIGSMAKAKKLTNPNEKGSEV